MSTADEIARQIARVEGANTAVRQLLEAQPLVWIPWRVFSQIAPCSWRTRISVVRKRIAQDSGGTVEWNRNCRQSAYRLVPFKPLGRSAEIPRTQPELF